MPTLKRWTGTAWDVVDSRMFVNARDYGASPTATASYNSGALQAAIAAGAAAKLEVGIPAGLSFDTTLVLPNRSRLRGSGRQRTILTYTGSGSALTQSTIGTRVYDLGLQDLTIVTASGAVGLDLESVNTSEFESLLVQGFSDCGIKIYSSVFGGAVYNRFRDVTVQTCATGYKIFGTGTDSANAEIFLSCRANNCATRGWDMQDCNDNALIACQIEVCGTGVYLDGTVLGANDAHRLIGCRFENNAVGWEAHSANVRDLHVSGTVNAANTTNFIDNGTSTRRSAELIYAKPTNSVVSLDAGWQFSSGASINLGSTSAALAAYTATPLYLKGNAPNTAAGVATWLGNGSTLSTAGARVAGFCKDTPITHASPVSYINIDGSYEFVGGPKVMSGAGSPAGVVTAPVGSMYLRSDGGANTTLWIKESGTGNTGWIAK